MPAWMARIQVRRMRPETSMSAWIPALHAGMTESRSRTKTDPGPPPRVFSKEFTEIRYLLTKHFLLCIISPSALDF